MSRSSSRDEVFSQLQRRGVEAVTEGQSRGGRGQESSTGRGGSSSSCQAVGKCSLEERESCRLFTLKVPVSPSFPQPSKATDHPEESTVLHFHRHPPSVHSYPNLSTISSPSLHAPAPHPFLTRLPPLIFPLPLLESGGLCFVQCCTPGQCFLPYSRCLAHAQSTYPFTHSPCACCSFSLSIRFPSYICLLFG